MPVRVDRNAGIRSDRSKEHVHVPYLRGFHSIWSSEPLHLRNYVEHVGVEF
jgi:hypothetical protein